MNDRTYFGLILLLIAAFIGVRSQSDISWIDAIQFLFTGLILITVLDIQGRVEEK